MSVFVCVGLMRWPRRKRPGGGGGALAGRLFPSKVTRKRGKSGVTRILLTLIFWSQGLSQFRQGNTCGSSPRTGPALDTYILHFRAENLPLKMDWNFQRKHNKCLHSIQLTRGHILFRFCMLLHWSRRIMTLGQKEALRSSASFLSARVIPSPSADLIACKTSKSKQAMLSTHIFRNQ